MKIFEQEKIIKLYEDYFHFRGQPWPVETRDALDFVVSEVGEIFDALLRSKPDKGFVRHNERKTDLGMEISQAIMMLMIAANSAGIDVQEATYKWMRSKGFEPEYFTGEDYSTWAIPTKNSTKWHIWGKFGKNIQTIQSACGLEFPPEEPFYNFRSSPSPPSHELLCDFCLNYWKSRQVVDSRKFGEKSLSEKLRIILGKDKRD